MSDQIRSWAPTAEERRQAAFAGAQAMASFVGPVGPLVVWGVEWAYNRRDLIFDWLGIPRRAYTADRAPLALSALRTTSETGLVSINTPLTAAARRLGLRQGDPVSVVVAGDQYLRNRSGLVVPTRIGERVDVSVPTGSYSLKAFGGRSDTLFSAPDPYLAVGSGNLLVAGRSQFDLSLTARSPAPPLTHRTSSMRCSWCAAPVFGALYAHRLTCPSRPANACLMCDASFYSGHLLRAHQRREHGEWWERLYQYFGDRI